MRSVWIISSHYQIQIISMRKFSMLAMRCIKMLWMLLKLLVFCIMADLWEFTQTILNSIWHQPFHSFQLFQSVIILMDKPSPNQSSSHIWVMLITLICLSLYCLHQQVNAQLFLNIVHHSMTLIKIIKIRIKSLPL
jgi:CDP-diglyceride synthetase